MTQRDSDFRIKKENHAAALAAIQALATQTKSMGGGSSSGERWFSWVTTEEFVNASTLALAMSAWRWEVDCDTESGDVIDITFCGEKLGDDSILLETIAPFVERGSYIDMEGEDGRLWRWAFDGGGVVELDGKVSYE